MEGLPGGFLGVDVFFVISGYLITAILYGELSAGTFSIAAFYERRARRLLPALFFMLLSVGAFGWFFFVPQELRDFGKSAFATSMFVSNVLFWISAKDYFAAGADEMHLLHTWTLGVEEQFYLLFPLIILSLHAVSRRRSFVTGGVAVIGIVSFGVCLWLSDAAPSANFYLLPSRVWELTFGGALALTPIAVSVRTKEALSAIGLLLILVAYFSFDEWMNLPNWHTVAPVLGAGLLLSFSSKTYVGRLLSFGPFVWLGLISYSLYLWHQPVLVIERSILQPDGSFSQIAIGTLVSIVFASLSWRFVETPFRKRRVRRRSLPTLCVAAVSSVITAGLGAMLWQIDGAPWRFHNARAVGPDQLAIASRNNGYCFLDFTKTGLTETGEDLTPCHLGSSAPEARNILLFGDSYAGQYEPLLDRLGKANSLSITAVTMNWCHPASDQGFRGRHDHPSFEQCRINRLWVGKHLKEFDAVILGATWGGLKEDGLMNSTLQFVHGLGSQGVPIVLLPSPYQFRKVALDRYLFGLSDKLPSDTDADERQVAALAAVEDAAGDGPVFSISREALFPRLDSRPGLTSDGKSYSMDGRHISVFGALTAADNFTKSGEERQLLHYLALILQE